MTSLAGMDCSTSPGLRFVINPSSGLVSAFSVASSGYLMQDDEQQHDMYFDLVPGPVSLTLDSGY